MKDRITRRDFIDGFACSVLAAGAGRGGAADTEGQSTPPYPPARLGYRGSQPQDFAVAHGVRDGRRYDFGAAPISEDYDLVVIGAGIGGLASAWYFRQAHPHARVLIIDNHDDFGGHARRNEFDVGGRLLLGYGGSESMDSPLGRWSQVARDCVAAIGVDLNEFQHAYHHDLYSGLGLSSGLFFPREVFGEDRLITGDPVRSLPTDIPRDHDNAREPAAFIADWPVDEAQRARLLALLTDRRDVLSGQSRLEKYRLLRSLSYREYLKRYFELDDRSLAMFDGRTLDLFASKSSAVPALYAWALQYPGFQGLNLPLPQEALNESQPYIYHFPDGNASLARLFVRRLIPSVAPGHTMDDIVTARFDYGQLDRPGQPVRLRLSATAVALGNTWTGVRVLYAQGERLTHVSARHAIYAGHSAMLPYICNELGERQRKAVAAQVRAPLAYVNVVMRNWRPWVQRGVHFVNNPTGFFTNFKLDYPVSLGDYRFPTRPEEPMVVHMVHVPWPDGPVSDLRSAWRAGRAQLYARTFEEFESHARDELGRVLGPGGFEPERDIAAITVNRWGHGYAYDPDPLFDPPDFERIMRISATALGRIHFAGTDAAWEAYADRAIDSAQRAVAEIQA